MTAEWEEKSLGDLIDIKHGFAFSGKHIHDEPRGNILLTPGNFAIGGGFKDDKFKYFDGEVPNEFVLQPGDLLVTMTDLSKQADTLGYPAILPNHSGRSYLHNQRLGKIEVKPGADLDERFLFYLLRTREYRNEILASATGTTVKHTSPKRILAHRAKVPPLAEQKAIAAVLGALDDKIELNRRMNATLEAMARALFQSWFVDFDPVRRNMDKQKNGKNSSASSAGALAEVDARFPNEFEDSELGPIPKGWKLGKVSDGFNVTMGQSPPGETYNEDGAGLPFYQGRADFGFRFPKRRVFCTAPTRLAQTGDTLVSVRAPVGDINMADEECCVGRGVAAVRHKSGATSFTYYAMENFESDFARFEAEGTVFGSINKQDFSELTFVIAPEELVAAYERLASPFDNKIRILDHQSRTLVAIRDALLPKLLSGDVRLNQLQSLT